MNEIAPYKPQLVAGGKPRPIVPTNIEEAYRLANAVVSARMAPKGLDTPEACMIAIMHGMEIGLTPLMALQRIAVVNGRPTLWGDGAMALVRASGLCDGIREYIDGTGDARTAVCEARRRGEDDPIIRTFSVADAKKAGLWNKQGPWVQYPERMLQMRARAFALRDGFADVLGGMYLREELEDGPMRDVTPREPVMAPPPPPPPPAPAVEVQPPAEPAAAPAKRRGRPPRSAAPAPAPEPETPIEDVITADEPQEQVELVDEPEALEPEEVAAEPPILELARQKATYGTNALRLFKGRLSADDATALAPYWPQLQAAAEAADKSNTDPNWRDRA